MDRILSKENLQEWTEPYGMTIIAASACVILLVAPDRSMLSAVFGLAFMYFWVYFFHRALHFLPTEGPLKYINTHWIFHHQPLKILDRRVELLLETVNDLVMSLIVLWLQGMTGIWIIPTSVILFYAIWYTSVHIVNYSIIGSPVHRNHHKNVGTNFGPDVLDHLFGTNHEPEKEDIIYLAPNLVIAFGIVFLLKQCIKWKD